MTTSSTGSRKWGWLVAGLMVATQAGAALDQDDRRAETAGDYLQVGVPLAALALTFLFDDAPAGKSGLAGQPGSELDVGWPQLNGSPRHDLALAIGRTEMVTYGLKYGVTEERPNGGGHSFPSGHTSVAFSGAEFIRKQYGWSLGAPAYLTAAFVGWSRVESGNHWTHDVLAGAAIGILSNHDDLSFQVPLGRGGYGTLSVAPALMGAPPLLGFEPPDPADEILDMPATVAPGLHFSFRF